MITPEVLSGLENRIRAALARLRHLEDQMLEDSKGMYSCKILDLYFTDSVDLDWEGFEESELKAFAKVIEDIATYAEAVAVRSN